MQLAATRPVMLTWVLPKQDQDLELDKEQVPSPARGLCSKRKLKVQPSSWRRQSRLNLSPEDIQAVVDATRKRLTKKLRVG